MDHLPYPISNLARSEIKVQYLCATQFVYDDLDFFSYPLRAGIDLDDLCARDEASSASLAPFLQAWLWFGLLGETLGVRSFNGAPQKDASYKSFIKTSQDCGPVLTTVALRKTVMIRRKTFMSSSADDSRRERYDSSLVAAANAVNGILSTSSVQKQITKAKNPHDLGLVPTVLLSIQILVESLRSYRNYLFSLGDQHPLPKISNFSLCSDLLNVLLKEAGWRESDIGRIDADLQIRFVVSSTFRHDAWNHTTHTPDEQGSHIAVGDIFVPRHTRSFCRCDMVEIPHHTAHILAQDGKTPLLTYCEVPGGSRSVQIQEISAQLQSMNLLFVAFSHVRNQGLGNSSRLALPHCQMALLQETANEAVGLLHTSVPFYIDTMCVPLDRESKSRALKELPRIFECATAVIVLDPCLMNATVGSAVDGLLRIRYSAWKSRLWTLQEGSLAQNLLFKFSNRTFNLDELLRTFEPEAPLSILSRALEANEDHSEKKLRLDRIDAFNRDVKGVKDVPMVSGSGSDIKASLRSMVRLGYLGLPRFRYFRGEMEHTYSSIVLQALEGIYWDPWLVISKESLQSRLYQMYSMVKTQMLNSQLAEVEL